VRLLEGMYGLMFNYDDSDDIPAGLFSSLEDDVYSLQVHHPQCPYNL
jgi:hypothetical protein